MKNIVVVLYTLLIMLLISNKLFAGDIAKGLKTYNDICFHCHGRGTKGDECSNIVGVDSSEIEYAINSVDIMRFLKNRLSEESIENIVTYLQSLDRNKLKKNLIPKSFATTKPFLGKPANTEFIGC